MRKITIATLSLLLLTAASNHAQLRLIKSPEEVNGFIHSFTVSDNDLLFSAHVGRSGTAVPYGSYVSNGTAEGTLLVSPDVNKIFYFDKFSTFPDALNLYGSASYVLGDTPYLISNGNVGETSFIYKLNKSRMQAELVEATDGQVFPINGDRFFVRRKIDNPGGQYPDFSFNYQYKIYTPNGTELIEFNNILNPEKNNETELINSSGHFYFKDRLFFSGRDTKGLTNLFAANAIGVEQVTDYWITRRNSVGVNPHNLRFSGNFIYFTGEYAEWDEEDDSVINGGADVCFTNGDPELGFENSDVYGPSLRYSSNGLARGDGTKGYVSLRTREFYPDTWSKMFEVVENGIIYFSSRGSGAYFVTTRSAIGGTDQQLLPIPNADENAKRFVKDGYAYIFLRNANGEATIYKTNGNPSTVKAISVPQNTDLGIPLYNIDNHFDITEDKLYFSGTYEGRTVRQATLFSYDFSSETVTVEAQLPLNIVNVSNLKRFNNGFVFTSSRKKIFSYDVEIRSAYIDPPGRNKEGPADGQGTLDLNTREMNYNLSDVALTNTERIKIQILDTASAHFEYVVGSLADNKYSKSYYKINTESDDNAMSGEMVLSYVDDDFISPVTKPEDFEVYDYSNGSFVPVAIKSVDLMEKTVTFDADFDNDAVLFFRNKEASLSARTVQLERISAYPNPVEHVLHLDFPQTADYSVIVYDISGKQLVREEFPATSKASIIMNAYAKGIYLVRVESNGAGKTFKVIKK